MDYHGAFESDDERALVHIPMAMRYRLDKSGIKLALRQWQELPMALRRRLLELRCDTDAAIDDFRRELAALVKRHVDEDVTRFTITRPLPWERERARGEVNEALRQSDCDAVSDETWGGLSDFQRYVLVAFARPGRISGRLPGALREFCDALQRETRDRVSLNVALRT